MKQYDEVVLTQDIEKYKKGTVGIIVELFDNKVAYLEILDDDGDTIGMLYDIPLSMIKMVK
jgi:hypothetical protein